MIPASQQVLLLLLLQCLRKIGTHTLVISLTLILYLGIPVGLLLVLLPLFTFRWLLFKTARHFRPDLGKMLTALSSSFVVKIPFVYDTPKNTFAVYAVLDGHIGMDMFRQNFLRLLKVQNGEDLMYGEFKQYLTSFMGYYFWKNEDDFQIEQHVKFYETQERYSDLENSDTVVNLVGDVLKKPFMRKTSPWEFLILHGEKGDKKTSLVIVRLHHCLSDGFSLFKFVLEHAQATESVKQAQPNFQKEKLKAERVECERKSKARRLRKPVGACDRILQSLRKIFFPIRAPYEIASQFINCYDRNPWHLPEKEMSRDNCGFVTQQIPTRLIKDIKNSADASFAGVILAAFAGGIRKSMLDNKGDVSESDKSCIPRHINCLTPLPLPNHTLKLRNYMTACFVKLPLRSEDELDMDSRRRLREIEKNIKNIKESTVLQTNYVVHKAAGCLPGFLLQKVWKPTLCTCTLSSFPGPEEEAVYLGHRMSDTGFLGNIDIGNLGLSMTLFSYNGNIRICIGADKSILRTRKEVEALMKNIINELNLLYQEEIV